MPWLSWSVGPSLKGYGFDYRWGHVQEAIKENNKEKMVPTMKKEIQTNEKLKKNSSLQRDSEDIVSIKNEIN